MKAMDCCPPNGAVVTPTIRLRVLTDLTGASMWFINYTFYSPSQVKNRYRQFISHESLEVARRAEKKMTFIPIVFILLRMWGTIRFFLHLYDKGHDSVVLVYLQVWCFSCFMVCVCVCVTVTMSVFYGEKNVGLGKRGGGGGGGCIPKHKFTSAYHFLRGSNERFVNFFCLFHIGDWRQWPGICQFHAFLLLHGKISKEDEEICPQVLPLLSNVIKNILSPKNPN